MQSTKRMAELFKLLERKGLLLLGKELISEAGCGVKPFGDEHSNVLGGFIEETNDPVERGAHLSLAIDFAEYGGLCFGEGRRLNFDENALPAGKARTKFGLSAITTCNAFK